jgi:hypothetical protein
MLPPQFLLAVISSVAARKQLDGLTVMGLSWQLNDAKV